MEIYFAPLEGITGYIFRNAFSHSFGQPDKFFTPFLIPGGRKGFGAKERAEIAPEHNEGLNVVPQLLTRDAADFLRACEELAGYGYREVNLNLGCPSGTVVGKGRGAGFLADPGALEAFFDEVFARVTVAVSVKTRLGMESLAEWEDVLRLFNQYPICELIVHPRLRTELYRGRPHLEAFAYAEQNGKSPLCYNGDLTSPDDYARITERFPTLDRVMIGRGFLSDPFLLGSLRTMDGETPSGQERQIRQPVQQEEQRDMFRTFGQFHEELLREYRAYMSGETPVLFKMKELWFYMQALFPEDAKLYKKIKKSKNLAEYESIVRMALAAHAHSQDVSGR